MKMKKNPNNKINKNLTNLNTTQRNKNRTKINNCHKRNRKKNKTYKLNRVFQVIMYDSWHN